MTGILPVSAGQYTPSSKLSEANPINDRAVVTNAGAAGTNKRLRRHNG